MGEDVEVEGELVGQVSLSEVGRRGVSQFSQFFLDLGGSYLEGRNRSCTALHRSKDRESNGKPARVSGDQLV